MKVFIAGVCGFVGSALARHLVESGTVSATLGQDNIQRGRVALIAGLLGVVAFMVIVMALVAIFD